MVLYFSVVIRDTENYHPSANGLVSSSLAELILNSHASWLS